MKTLNKIRVAWHVFWAIQSRQKIAIKLAIAQLRLIGYSAKQAHDEIKNNPTWYSDNTWTSVELERAFSIKARAALKKKFKLTEKQSHLEWGWFNLSYGLRSYIVK